MWSLQGLTSKRWSPLPGSIWPIEWRETKMSGKMCPLRAVFSGGQARPPCSFNAICFDKWTWNIPYANYSSGAAFPGYKWAFASTLSTVAVWSGVLGNSSCATFGQLIFSLPNANNNNAMGLKLKSREKQQQQQQLWRVQNLEANLSRESPVCMSLEYGTHQLSPRLVAAELKGKIQRRNSCQKQKLIRPTLIDINYVNGATFSICHF